MEPQHPPRAPAPRRADWDALRALGLPLGGAAAPIAPTPERLARELRLALHELSDGDLPGDADRHRDTLLALVFALHQHFPTFYRRHLAGAPGLPPTLLDAPPGRVIKLARIATRTLATYL